MFTNISKSLEELLSSNIPENVKTDYLEGAKEIIRYLISNGCKDEKLINLGNKLDI